MAEDREKSSSNENDTAKVADAMPLHNGTSVEEEEPDFSDPEDFVDNITDEELLGDLLKQKPKETDGVESIIVIDGIPQVGQEKLEKLKKVIKKFFDKYGKIVNEHYPEENGKTKGYVFLEYSNPNGALEAAQKGNPTKLDKNHILSVNLFTDFDKYMNVPDQWEPPEPQPYKDPGNLASWLMNPDAYDQYSVIFEGGETTGIWNNSVPEPTLVEQRPRWTETYVRWSPLGTYLATFHPRGIALWGGDKFKQIMKFGHGGVQYIDFSPCEKYIVTFSSHTDVKEDPQSIIIWDIRMGSKKRVFPSERPSIWPVFKWSHDDKYFARLTQDGTESALSIYETPSFGLLDKKSIKITGIRDISWSPSDNVIAYWVEEDKDVPARMNIIEIPTRNELRGKNQFNCADCKMHWQKSGDFLCVKIDRYAKQKKDKNETKYSGLSYNLEIFRMREKQIPVDSVEIKEHITAFAWEPIGSKFCLIHGEGSNISVSFYDAKAEGSIILIKKFERRSANHLFWAPCGQFIVLAELRSMTGSLEFIDTSDMTIMGTGEHYMATDVEWDPTGRYVVTAVSFWSHKMDNAYWVWSFQGKKLQRHALDRFCQLLWRPRPASLLTADQIRDIAKNLGKFSSQFEAKDRLNITKASKELVEKRRLLLEDFENLRKQKREEYNSQKSERMRLRNHANTDELNSHTENMETEVVEFFTKEEIIELEE